MYMCIHRGLSVSAQLICLNEGGFRQLLPHNYYTLLLNLKKFYSLTNFLFRIATRIGLPQEHIYAGVIIHDNCGIIVNVLYIKEFQSCIRIYTTFHFRNQSQAPKSTHNNYNSHGHVTML